MMIVSGDLIKTCHVKKYQKRRFPLPSPILDTYFAIQICNKTEIKHLINNLNIFSYISLKN